MKTLNKTLCLVLALVMVLGLFGVASAAEFTDAADVQYKEAVGVMTGIGAVNGYEDGSVKPQGFVTREEAAKMIVYAILGKDVADKLTVSSDPFNDVAADRWSAPFIAYLVGQGVIDGMGDGSFAPTKEVTGYQFAKMMLCAAGYGAQGEYTGENWQLATARDMMKYNISKGAANIDFSKPATREEAMLYAFNGISVAQVEYNKAFGAYVGKGTGISGGTGATIAAEIYGLTNTAGVDAFGRTTKKWSVDTTKVLDAPKDGVVAQIAKSADYTVVVNDPTKTTLAYWLATANKQLAIDAKGSATSATTVDYTEIILNGDDTTSLGEAETYTVSTTYVPKVGDVIEIFVDTTTKTAITKIVVTRYALTKLAAPAKAAAGTVDAKGNTVTYTLDDAAGKQIASTKDTEFPGYVASTYVKDAIIAVAANGAGKVLASYIPEAKTGAIKAFTNNAVVNLDGTSYYFVGTADEIYNPSSITSATVDWKTGSYKVYTDKNGTALGLEVVTATAALTDVYYINDVWAEESTAYGKTTNKVFAQVVTLDGTISTLEIGFDAGTQPGEGSVENTYYSKSATGEYTLTSNQSASVTYYKFAATAKTFVTLIQNPTTKIYAPTVYNPSIAVNGYEIKSDATDYTSVLTKTGYVFTGTKAAYLTADTKYLVITESGALAAAKVITGGISTSESVQVIASQDTAKNYIAEYVVLDLNGKYTGVQNADDMLYVPKASTVVNGTGTYAVTVYDMKGESKTITAKSAGVNNTFFTYAIDADGVYTLEPATNTQADDSSFPAETGSTRHYIWAKTMTGVVYNEIFAGVHGTSASFANETRYIDDVPAAAAKIIDLHDTAAAKAYPSTVSNAIELATAASTIAQGTTPYQVVFNAYISETGAVIIFVTSIADPTP